MHARTPCLRACMPAHAPARARPTSPAPLCTRRRRVARSNTQVIYLACASGHASTAFTVCRAVSEDLMVSQVDALLSLVSAALDDEVYCQQARAQAPCSGGALRSGGSAGLEGARLWRSDSSAMTSNTLGTARTHQQRETFAAFAPTIANVCWPSASSQAAISELSASAGSSAPCDLRGEQLRVLLVGQPQL